MPPFEKHASRTLLNWLGFSDHPNWERAKPLGVFIGFITVILFALAMISSFKILIILIFSTTGGAAPQPSLGSGALIVALLGAPFLIWRTLVAQKTLDFKKEGLMTDRIAKAVDQLGAERSVKRRIDTNPERPMGEGDSQGRTISDDWLFEDFTEPNMEVRLGGIYSLERIAKDSVEYDDGRDHLTVMEILCAYLRHNSPVVSLEPKLPPFKTEAPRIDIQAIIDVLARRSFEQKKIEHARKFRLNLSNCHLSSISFRGGDFSAVLFHRCRLECADFTMADLTGTQFNDSLLNYASFWKSKLKGTKFDRVTLNLPNVQPGGMAESINFGEIHGISLIGAEITALNHIGTVKIMQKTFGTKDTKLHGSLQHARLKFFRRNPGGSIMNDDHNSNQDIENNHNDLSTGFKHWSAYDSRDLSTAWHLSKFYDEMGLRGWPFRD